MLYNFQLSVKSPQQTADSAEQGDDCQEILSHAVFDVQLVLLIL